MASSRDGLTAKKYSKKGKDYIYIRDSKTGRFVKGTNKRFSKTHSLDVALSKALTFRQPKKEKRRGNLILIINISYVPRSTGRQHHLFVGEFRVDITYELEDEFSLTSNLLENQIKSDKTLLSFCADAFDRYVETRIPYNDIGINVERHKSYESNSEGTRINTSAFIRGRNITTQLNITPIERRIQDILDSVIK